MSQRCWDGGQDEKYLTGVAGLNCVLAVVAVVLLGVVGPLVGNFPLSNVFSVVPSLLIIAMLETRMWTLAQASTAAAASSAEAAWGLFFAGLFRRCSATTSGAIRTHATGGRKQQPSREVGAVDRSGRVRRKSSSCTRGRQGPNPGKGEGHHCVRVVEKRSDLK